jgi:[acyl-carrier-protein] S-malonyltransferase
MTLEEAMTLVRERGLAMAEAAERNPGSMAAILGLADEVVEGLCRRILGVWPANYNCPGQIVVSGETLAVDECIELAQSHGARRAVKLKVSGAFHSQLTAPVRFTQSATELMRGGVRTFVEVGPGDVLSGLVRRIDRSVKAVSINSIKELDRLPELLSEA